MRVALRMLRRSPGFAAVTVVSLALGFALTASTLSVVNAYLIQSLPFPGAERLYHVIYAPQGQPEPRGISAIDWAPLSDIVETTNASAGARFYLTGGRYTEEALGLRASPGMLDNLGVHAVLGRTLQDEDFRQGSELVAMIGHALWRDRFGSDPAVLGRTFQANAANVAAPPETFRIVGVLPPDFRDPGSYGRGVIDVVAPLRTPMRTQMVRLRRGIPVESAERRITDVARTATSSIPANWNGVKLESVHERYITGLRPLLTSIATAVGLLLVIVSANVAVLLLLRSMRRQKEVAVRVALGAGRAHVVRMLAIETCVICAAGLLLGLTLTYFALQLLAPAIEEQLGRPVPGGTSAIGLNATVLLMVGGLGAIIALALSFIPFLTPWQNRLADTLRRDGRSGTDAPLMRRIRSGLIAVEIAGSLALLVGCGLMIRSALNLVRTDLGIRTENIQRWRIALPNRTYPDAATQLAFYDRFGEQLSTLSNTPFVFTNFPSLIEPGNQALEADSPNATAFTGLGVGVLSVSPGYFAMLGIDIRQGRAFAPTDRLGAEAVAIVSDTLARRLWPGENPVGHRLRTPELPGRQSPLTVWRRVVGVARDIRQTYTDENLYDVYLSFLQAPNQYTPLYLKTDQPADQWYARIRTAAAEIDRDVLIAASPSLASDADRQLAGTRFLTSMLTGFAVFAALLALLGVYGVTTYAVQQRKREVAIRMAVGATRTTVVAMFLKEGGLVLGCGVVLGLLGAMAIGRVLANQLHGVQPLDVSTLAAAAAVMLTAGLVATWWPVQQATARSPMSALKED